MCFVFKAVEILATFLDSEVVLTNTTPLHFLNLNPVHGLQAKTFTALSVWQAWTREGKIHQRKMFCSQRAGYYGSYRIQKRTKENIIRDTTVSYKHLNQLKSCRNIWTLSANKSEILSSLLFTASNVYMR